MKRFSWSAQAETRFTHEAVNFKVLRVEMPDPEHAERFYSIGYISRACEIPTDTIRTWERRYGYPSPVRLASGHRRYSGDTIERLCLVKEAIGAGIRPARALRTSPPLLRELLSGSASEVSGEQDPGSKSLSERCAASIRSCLLDAEHLREDLITAELERRWSDTSPLDYIEKFVMPLMAAIGDAWFRGSLGVAHEHCTSALVASFLAQRWRCLNVPTGGAGLVVCATLPDDRHIIPLHAASLILRDRGVPTLFLGADTPIEESLAALQQRGACALVLSVSSAVAPAVQLRSLSAIRRALPATVEVCYGGQKCPEDIPGVTYLPTFSALACWAAKHALPR